MDPTPTEPAIPRPSPPVHHLAGWIVVALVDATALAGVRAPIQARAAMHFHTAFNLVAAGLAITALAALTRRVPRLGGRLRYALTGAALAALAYPTLGDDLSGPAGRLSAAIPLTVWIAVLSAVTAQAILLAAALGSLLAKRWIRALGIALAIAIAAANGRLFAQSYPGLHLLATAAAATLAGACLRDAPLLARITPASTRVRLALGGALAAAAIASLVVRPSNAVRTLLAREPIAVFSPFLGWGGGKVSAKRVIPPQQREWFASRNARPPVAPSAPPLLPNDAIVLLIGIDSMRADLIADEARRSQLPALFALKDSSTYFATARSAGASTVPSLTAIFSGVYYSQLYWTKREDFHDPLPFPHEDTSPRFPEQLSAAGVHTVNIDGFGRLSNQTGVVRGFEVEASRPSTYAKVMTDAVLDHLRAHDRGRMFLFAHMLDAHWPYTRAGQKSTPFEGYLSELGIVDHEIARILAALAEPRIAERACLIVMSDHGEAFGEHRVNTHSQNLYDELLRVPLMIRLPGGKPQVVEDPVSLIDLGPTILDLMGVATPGRYMGQSLVGFLRGSPPKLLRPIVAEARLKKGMVTPDGFKIIHDPIAHTVEIFDLAKDPGEQDNLYIEGSAASAERLGVLNAFFHAHTLKRAGYKVPYRPW